MNIIMIKPQELGNILEDQIQLALAVNGNDCVIIKPGMSRIIKTWVKSNGRRTGQTEWGAYPIYQLSYIPMCLRKRDRMHLGESGSILKTDKNGNHRWVHPNGNINNNIRFYE